MAPKESKESKDEVVTLDNLDSTLSKDTRVKLAGVDVDGKDCSDMLWSTC